MSRRSKTQAEAVDDLRVAMKGLLDALRPTRHPFGAMYDNVRASWAWAYGAPRPSRGVLISGFATTGAVIIGVDLLTTGTTYLLDVLGV